ncbi:MAG: PilZ domain-containing protein [Nannocystaceae bacterium]
MGTERRKSQRYAINFAVEISSSGRGLECAGADLSLGGLRLVVSDPPVLAVGDRVEVSFRLPALEQIVRVGAIVRWVDREDDRNCGLQFTAGLRAREVWAINQIFDSVAS